MLYKAREWQKRGDLVKKGSCLCLAGGGGGMGGGGMSMALVQN